MNFSNTLYFRQRSFCCVSSVNLLLSVVLLILGSIDS